MSAEAPAWGPAQVPILARKAGEISNAGRESFLAVEADRALTAMAAHCTDHRVVNALLAIANHRSLHVRAKVRRIRP